MWLGFGGGGGIGNKLIQLILHVMYVIEGGGGIEKCELLIIRENSRVLIITNKSTPTGTWKKWRNTQAASTANTVH